MPEYLLHVKIVKQSDTVIIPKDAIGVTLHVLRHGEPEPIYVDVAWLEQIDT